MCRCLELIDSLQILERNERKWHRRMVMLPPLVRWYITDNLKNMKNKPSLRCTEANIPAKVPLHWGSGPIQISNKFGWQKTRKAPKWVNEHSRAERQVGTKKPGVHAAKYESIFTKCMCRILAWRHSTISSVVVCLYITHIYVTWQTIDKWQASASPHPSISASKLSPWLNLAA